jgi:hypothetical protein
MKLGTHQKASAPIETKTASDSIYDPNLLAIVELVSNARSQGSEGKSDLADASENSYLPTRIVK